MGMKNLKRGFYLLLIPISSSFMLPNMVFAQAKKEVNTIYLITKEHEAYLEQLEGEKSKDPDLAPKEIKKLSDLEQAFQDDNTPMTKREKKIADRTRLEQKRLVELLDQFDRTDFDKEDDRAKPEFNKIRDEIVKLVFYAETKKSYWQRLYLINQSYLDHIEDVQRYASLDRALRDKWIAVREKRQRTREIIIGLTAATGAAFGGFLTYKASTKILPIAANESTLGLISKWGGRSALVIIGTYVGASVGSYAGFLGSDWLPGKREYIDPIDGNEDLRDILDIIDDL